MMHNISSTSAASFLAAAAAAAAATNSTPPPPPYDASVPPPASPARLRNVAGVGSGQTGPKGGGKHNSNLGPRHNHYGRNNSNNNGPQQQHKGVNGGGHAQRFSSSELRDATTPAPVTRQHYSHFNFNLKSGSPAGKNHVRGSDSVFSDGVPGTPVHAGGL